MKTLAALSCLLLLTSGLFACQVPVFRFALERWAADNFELLVTSHGPLDPKLAQELAYLQETLEAKPPPINLKVRTVDLDTLTEVEKLSLPALEHLDEQPSMVLLPPESWMTTEPAWTGPATPENLRLLIDSPARQRCAGHLLKGESAVWIVVESGDPEKDSKAKALLEAGLARASSVIEVPIGVVRREDLNPEIENIDLDDVLRSDIPLQISFVTETISRDDPAEAIFLPTLVEPEALQSGEPLIVPVFGRGRTPGALPASQISVERIFGACEYLCGACSCQVKSGNPGYDLLFKTSWDSLLHSTVITADSEIVQQALDVVSFNPPAPKPGNAPASGGGLPFLPAVIALAAVILAGAAFMAMSKPASAKS